VASINRQIAEELGVREQQVEATVALLDGGATVPFVARYRKEITGGLDDAQLRTLEERLNYLRELEERRTAILNSVREQGKLDPQIDAALNRGWPLKRIEAVLRAVLRAGAYELACRADVPARVVMSEYVDVAGAFVDDDETGMVNAVLETFLQKPNVGCISCHQYATVAAVGSQKPNIAASYSFMFKRASPGPQ